MNKNPNRENLKPFKKGVDERRNLDGRPPKLPQLDVLLDSVLGEEKDGITAAEAILKALRMKASKGDVRAAEVLLDRAYGKAKQLTEINGNLGITKINVVRERSNNNTQEPTQEPATDS